MPVALRSLLHSAGEAVLAVDRDRRRRDIVGNSVLVCPLNGHASPERWILIVLDAVTVVMTTGSWYVNVAATFRCCRRGCQGTEVQ